MTPARAEKKLWMTVKWPVAAIVVAAAAAIALATAGRLSGQTRSAADTPPRRTVFGQPDLSGFWQINGLSTVSLEVGYVDVGRKTGARHYEIPPYSPEFGRDRPDNAPRPNWTGPTGIVDPPDGKIPWLPWAAARKEDVANHVQEPQGKLDYVDSSARCLSTGVPRFNYATPYNGYQFLQTKDQVVLLAEYNHQYRIIPLDNRPHLGSSFRMWMGDSRGRWDGNTLVVDVTNFNGKTWLDMYGSFHSDTLHVVERYTVVDDQTIGYEATLEDPQVYSQPWKIAGYFSRAEPGYELFEYACIEGSEKQMYNMLNR
jgi:hypothetical protein